MQSFFRRKPKDAPPPAQGAVLGRLDAAGNEIWAPAHQPTTHSSTLASSYAPCQAPAAYGQPYAEQQQQQQPLYRTPSPSIASVHSRASRKPTTQFSHHPPSTTSSSHPPRARAPPPSLRRQNSSGSIRDFVQDVGSRAREGLAHVARRASIDRRRPDPSSELGKSSYASSSSTSINHLTAPRLGLGLGLGYGRAAKSATELRLGRSTGPGATAPPMPHPSHPATTTPSSSSAGTTHSPSVFSHLQQQLPVAPTPSVAHPPPARRTFQQTARTSMESVRKLGRKASVSSNSRNRKPVPAVATNGPLGAQHHQSLTTYAPLNISTSMHSPSLRNEGVEDPWGDPFAAEPQPIPTTTTTSSSVRTQPMSAQAVPDTLLSQPQLQPSRSQPQYNSTPAASYTYPYAPSQAPSQPSIRNGGSRSSIATSRPSTATSNHSSSFPYQTPTKQFHTVAPVAGPAAPTGRVTGTHDQDSSRSASINSSTASRLMPLASQRIPSTSSNGPVVLTAGKAHPHYSDASQPVVASEHAHQRSQASQGSTSIVSHSHSTSGGAQSLASSHSITTSIPSQAAAATQPVRKRIPHHQPQPQQQVVSRAFERELPLVPPAGNHYARPRDQGSSVHNLTNPYDGYASPAATAAAAQAPPPKAKTLPSTPPKRSPIGLGISGISMEGTVQPTPPRADFRPLASDRSNLSVISTTTRNQQQPQPQPQPQPQSLPDLQGQVPQAPPPPPPKSPPPGTEVYPGAESELPDAEVEPEPEHHEQYRSVHTAPRLSLGQLDFGSDLGTSLGLDAWTSSWDHQSAVKDTMPDALKPAGITPSQPSRPSESTLRLTPNNSVTTQIRSASPATQRSSQAPSSRTERLSLHPDDEEASNALEGLMNALTSDSLEPDMEEPLTPGTVRVGRMQTHQVATQPVQPPTTHIVSGNMNSSASNEVPVPSPTTIRAYSPPSSAARRSSSVRRLHRISSRWSVGSGAKKKKVSTGVSLEQYPLPSPVAPPILSPSTPATVIAAANATATRPTTHEDVPTVPSESEPKVNHHGVDPNTLPAELQHLAPYLSPERADSLYSKSSIIGEGECGDVYCADTIARTPRCSSTPTSNKGQASQVAIKMVRRDTNPGQARLALLAQELELWHQVSSGFVVRLCGAFFEPSTDVGSIWIVHELMDRSVADILVAVSDGPLQWDESHMARIVSDTATGLAHLHAVGIVHRDCRSDNLLMGADGTTKLSDFTHAASLRSGPRHSVVGTPFWMAPEVILAKEYQTEIDLWSLGAVLWELVQGEPAYIDLVPREAVAQIARVGLPSLSYPEQWSLELKGLLTHLTQLNPQARPTATSVLSHPFCARAAEYGSLVRLLDQVHAVERGQSEV